MKILNDYLQLFEELIAQDKSPYGTLAGIHYKLRNTLSFAPEHITWEYIRQNIIDKSHQTHLSAYINLWLKFAIDLDKRGLLYGDLRGTFVKNEKSIFYYASKSFGQKFEVVTDTNFTPLSIILAPQTTFDEKYQNFLWIVPRLTSDALDFIMLYLMDLNDVLMKSRLERGLSLVYSVLFSNNCLYTNIDQYNDETFMLHFDMIRANIDPTIKNKGKPALVDGCLGELVNFYIWIQQRQGEELRNKNFKKFTLAALKYPRLLSLLKDHFDLVSYSIYDDPPHSDKWLLNPKNMMLHQSPRADKLWAFDTSVIQNKYLKQWLKECYWFDDVHNIEGRNTDYAPVISFLTTLDKKFTVDEMPSIGVDDILSYKAECVSAPTTDGTVARKLSMIKYFLKFLDTKQYLAVDDLLFRLLVHHDNKNQSYKETYTQEEIQSLLAAYKDYYETQKDSDRRLLYALFYYIIAIQAITEMRVSTILNLKTNCLVQTLERKKNSEYKVVVQSKTSGNEFDEYNITKYVKGLLDEVQALTKDLRQEATGIEKDYLFIFRRHNQKAISIIRQGSLARSHKRICQEYGIRVLKLGAIRNYYQQQVSNYVTKNGDDPMLIERLSKHGINVHIQHYDVIDIKDFCQRFYQVEIGSVQLKGHIEETNDRPKQNDVAHGCGHCELSECILKGNLECLMCDKFVTTLDCIPFFEKEIDSIDAMIIRQPLQHEKEFLNNKKRLNVAYLTKLYELEAKINGNRDI